MRGSLRNWREDRSASSSSSSSTPAFVRPFRVATLTQVKVCIFFRPEGSLHVEADFDARNEHIGPTFRNVLTFPPSNCRRHQPMHSRLQERRRVRVGIVGVGNCASSFVQGLTYYR